MLYAVLCNSRLKPAFKLETCDTESDDTCEDHPDLSRSDGTLSFFACTTIACMSDVCQHIHQPGAETSSLSEGMLVILLPILLCNMHGLASSEMRTHVTIEAITN